MRHSLSPAGLPSLKYLLLIVAVASPYASAFCVFPLPAVSDSLYELSYICWFAVAHVWLGLLLLRRWLAVAIFSVAGIWLFYRPSYGPNETIYWLVQQGFRFHAAPVKNYLAKCKLVEFTEGGIKQTVGFCEGADRGTVVCTVLYDTTGEYGLPLSQRTTEWREAMAKVLPEEALDWRATPLFGNFYSTVVSQENYRG
jgi:hypothetical protein